MKIRIDQLLVRNGFATDPKHATALLMSGVVYVEGQKVDKAGTLIADTVEIIIKSQSSKYVSRGGDKLEGALDFFGLDPDCLVCLDLGASTGGFTDCLLKRGAAKVYAFDVGKGQLDWTLRQDNRVIIHDNFNVRRIVPTDLPEAINLIVTDLSFISLAKIFPALAAFSNAKIIALIKPQFEARPEEVEKGGVIRDEEKRQELIARTIDAATKEGFEIINQSDSAIPGPKGNREHFVLMMNRG